DWAALSSRFGPRADPAGTAIGRGVGRQTGPQRRGGRFALGHDDAAGISIDLLMKRASMRTMGDWNRREFLRTASAATLSALAAGYPRRLWADEKPEEKIKATADTVIVLWMAGGMAQTETFDPKGFAPFEKGMAPASMASTFPSIDTAVDHIK